MVCTRTHKHEDEGSRSLFFYISVKIDAKISERYQQVMREWKACEVIVKQREKEMQSAIFAKLSSGSSIDSHVLRLVHRDSTLSNEVKQPNPIDLPLRGRLHTLFFCKLLIFVHKYHWKEKYSAFLDRLCSMQQ